MALKSVKVPDPMILLFEKAPECNRSRGKTRGRANRL